MSKMRNTIQVKVDYAIKSEIEKSARARGLSSSAWLRTLAITEMQKENKSPMEEANNTDDMPMEIKGKQDFYAIPSKICQKCELTFTTKNENENFCRECGGT